MSVTFCCSLLSQRPGPKLHTPTEPSVMETYHESHMCNIFSIHLSVFKFNLKINPNFEHASLRNFEFHLNMYAKKLHDKLLFFEP